MEAARTEVTAAQISTYMGELSSNIDGVPAHFVFNMDEVGHQDWADRMDTHCYVPAEYDAHVIHFPVPRTGKRITALVCIGADGSYLRPCLVIARQSFEDELVTYGFSAEKVEIYHQDKSFVDREIFQDWLKDTFVPEVRARRDRMEYAGPAYLILDNCSAHTGEEFEALCRSEGIHPIFIPPHSSHLVQPLDLSLFGLLKKRIAKINNAARCNVQTDHIVRIITALQSAAVTVNVVATFRAAGISLIDVVDGRKVPHPLCAVTPYTMRCHHEMFDRNLQELAQKLEELGEEEEDAEFDPSVDGGDGPSWDGSPRAVRKVVREIQDLVAQGQIERHLQNGPQIGGDGHEAGERRQDVEQRVTIGVVELLVG
jgi:hypothetical protein